MYINSISSNDISMKGKRNPKSWKNFLRNVKQKVFDVLPDATYKDGEKIRDVRNKVNDRISRPCENRVIMGFSAMAIQPTIDYYNPWVDEDTRAVSRNRTIAKILAGTAIGAFVVRGPVYKIVEKMTNPEGTSKFSKALIPNAKDIIRDLAKTPSHLKNYRSALAMVFSLVLMGTITNLFLDAPATLLLTDLINKITKKKEVENGHK